MSISLDEIQTHPQQLLGYDLQHTLMVSFGMVILGFTSLPHYIEKYRNNIFLSYIDVTHPMSPRASFFPPSPDGPSRCRHHGHRMCGSRGSEAGHRQSFGSGDV